MIWIEFAVLLTMILIGSQMKGIGLGVMGMVGLFIFLFVFKMKPTDPPLDVMLIIMAIVTTAATLQASGGLDYLVQLAEKIIRSNPSNITFIAPFTVYFYACLQERPILSIPCCLLLPRFRPRKESVRNDH